MSITDKILSNPGSSWVELFEKADFFGMYKTYVQVVASASTSDGIKDWSVAIDSSNDQTDVQERNSRIKDTNAGARS